MTKQMLVDAAHAEEIRMVVLDGDKIDDFEVETAGKQQIKGNIYVATVTRVEPSLQAAFVDYGGNRNGFLAFSEVHPACFDVDEEEKQGLLKELDELAKRRLNRSDDEEVEKQASAESAEENSNPDPDAIVGVDKDNNGDNDDENGGVTVETIVEGNAQGEEIFAVNTGIRRPQRHEKPVTTEDGTEIDSDIEDIEAAKNNVIDNSTNVESGENTEETPEKRQPPIHRRYNIQDVLTEGQQVIIQINKEERGNKGAAISTYISLAGRYVVMMPNTPYAGGISRKINSYEERKELKKAMKDVKIPAKAGVIVRTAGVGQDSESLQKDIDGVAKQWAKIEKTAKSSRTKTPSCIHENGSLLTRNVRDMLTGDIEELIISGNRAYKTAKDYVKSIMPEFSKNVKEHRAQTPIFTHYGVEEELNQLHRTKVDLPSGGYLIINPTEALVSIDVNSGRATHHRNIEETATKTNLEAADEVCRQLRLRDLAGLVVIDFIDMDDRRNERNVEKAMRKAIRKDRSRVQLAPISTFGLLEMSRQRMRPSLGESTFVACSHCNGSGFVPSLASSALMLLRSLEDESIRSKADRVIITTSADLAVYLLNHKRDLIQDMEARYKFQIVVHADNAYIGPDHKLELVRVSADGQEKTQTLEVRMRDESNLEKPKGRRRRGGRNRNDSKTSSDNTHKDTKTTSANNKADSGKTTSRKSSAEAKNADTRSDTKSATRDANPSKTSDEASSDEQGKRPRGVRRMRRPRNDKNNNQVEVSDKNATDSANKVAKNTSNPSETGANTQKSAKPVKRVRAIKSTEKTKKAEPVIIEDTPVQVTVTKASSTKAVKPKRTTAKKTVAKSAVKKSTKTTATTKKAKIIKTDKGPAVMVEHVSNDGKTSAQTADSSISKAFSRWWGKG